MQQDLSQTTGNLKISKEVIATIVKTAALEIEGTASIAAFGANIKGWLLNKQSLKPVSIEINDNIARISLYLNVKAGAHIPSVAEKVQAAVKEAVQSMTGITVNRVDIQIIEIVFEDAPQAV